MEQQACLDTIMCITPPPKLLFFSGSLPAGVRDDFYGRVIWVVPDDTRVMLDANGKAIDLGVESSAYLVKPNKRALLDCDAANSLPFQASTRR